MLRIHRLLEAARMLAAARGAGFGVAAGGGSGAALAGASSAALAALGGAGLLASAQWAQQEAAHQQQSTPAAAPCGSDTAPGTCSAAPLAEALPTNPAHQATAQWRVFTDVGRELVHQGRFKEAESFFLRALEAAKVGFGPEEAHVASACNNLAEFYRLRKQYDEAEPLYKEVGVPA